MKKLILSLAIASTLTIAVAACNSTKNVSGSSDSTAVDTTIKTPVDTPKVMDTIQKTPIDTTKMSPTQ